MGISCSNTLYFDAAGAYMKNATLRNLNGDPFFQRPVGLNEVSVSALQAQAYRHRYGLTDEHLALVVVKDLRNALGNPYAHRKSGPSLECAGPSDGGCAMLLASEEVARDLTDTPVWISGLGWSTSSYWLGDMDLLKGSLPSAASMAYQMAGIKDPKDKIDVAEGTLQVMRRAGEHQVPNVRRALAHSVHGLGEQVHTVVILQGIIDLLYSEGRYG